MGLTAGYQINAGEVNTLKGLIVNEMNRRNGYSFSPASSTLPNMQQGVTAKAEDINKLITPLRTINSTTTNFNTVSLGALVYAIAQLNSAVTTFQSYSKVGTSSGCGSGCLGLCQGCTGTCQGGCTSCTGCTGTCQGGCGGCTSCTGTCKTTCSGGCKGCTSCTGTCKNGCGGCGRECEGEGCSCHCSGGCGSIFIVDVVEIKRGVIN